MTNFNVYTSVFVGEAAAPFHLDQKLTFRNKEWGWVLGKTDCLHNFLHTWLKIIHSNLWAGCPTYLSPWFALSLPLESQ